MANDTHLFCRRSLALTMERVRLKFTKEEIARAWPWKVSNNQFEFHGPNGEYNHDVRMADCLWSASDNGWCKLLDVDVTEE